MSQDAYVTTNKVGKEGEVVVVFESEYKVSLCRAGEASRTLEV
jgi:hypothetical protein